MPFQILERHEVRIIIVKGVIVGRGLVELAGEFLRNLRDKRVRVLHCRSIRDPAALNLPHILAREAHRGPLAFSFSTGRFFFAAGISSGRFGPGGIVINFCFRRVGARSFSLKNSFMSASSAWVPASALRVSHAVTAPQSAPPR